MLNGVAPILIFHFNPSLTQSLLNGLSGIPVIGDVLPNLGIPIPIYLDENLSGILVESETKAIDIETQPQVRYDGGKPDVIQRGLNNLITINMKGTRNSMMLSVLLAMNDMIFSRVVSKSYSVSYLNGTTTVFNGLLHGFSTSVSDNDDMVRIVMQISKANLKPPTEGGITLVNKAITGATPVAVPQ